MTSDWLNIRYITGNVKSITLFSQESEVSIPNIEIKEKKEKEKRIKPINWNENQAKSRSRRTEKEQKILNEELSNLKLDTEQMITCYSYITTMKCFLFYKTKWNLNILLRSDLNFSS